jgi:uncharacterized membrane protein YfcA
MPEMSVLLPFVGLSMGLGAVAGVLAGLLGVGGGIVLVPGFFYAFSALGYDSPQLMQICLGTSLATIIVTSLRSLNAHNKKGAVEWDILGGWGLGLAIGAGVGVLVATQLRSSVLLALFGGLGICIGIYIAFGRSDWRLGDTMPKGAFRAIGSPLIGFLSVLMGIGGGSFAVPTMTLFGVPIHRAVATASGFGVILAVPSALGFLVADIDVAPPLTVGAVNFGAFGVVVFMTLITVPWGAALAHKMDPKPLKRVFGFFLILVALNMLRKVVFG